MLENDSLIKMHMSELLVRHASLFMEITNFQMMAAMKQRKLE